MKQLFSKLDRVVLVIVVFFLVIGVLAAVSAYGLAQSFFSTTDMIKVGDAPPIIAAGQGARPGETITPGGSSAGGGFADLPVNTGPTPEPWDGTSRVTILVMGLDYRDWEAGEDIPRTDSMLLLTIDPLTKTAGMLSIPRDMWVSIPGFGYNRINTAYRAGEANKLPGGGIALAGKTVEHFLGVPVNYAVLLDFNSVVRVIDELGGLDMHIREEITVDPIGPGNTVTLEPGVQPLDGATVLAYARMRYTNDGDFDRSKRQQEVIMALREQILTFNQLPMLIAKAPALYSELSSGIKTTLSLDQMIQLAVLATQVKEEDIKRGVFDPHKDVGYASVDSSEGRMDVLVPNPDQIRILRDEIFTTGGPYAPAAVSGSAELMKIEAARVVVNNGSSVAGLAGQAAGLMREQGVNITGEGNAAQAVGATTIVDYTGNPYTVKFLAEMLNVPDLRVKNNFDPNASLDVEVILGGDWTGQ